MLGSVLEHLVVGPIAQADVSCAEELDSGFPARNAGGDVLAQIMVGEEAGTTHVSSWVAAFFSARRRATTGFALRRGRLHAHRSSRSTFRT